MHDPTVKICSCSSHLIIDMYLNVLVYACFNHSNHKFSHFLKWEYSDTDSAFVGGFFVQVYLSLYTTIESMVDQVTTGAVVFGDSLSISGFKVRFMLNLYNCTFFLSNNVSKLV